MKKIIVIFTVIIAAIAVCLGETGAKIMHRAQYNEVSTVENIVGTVLAEYPEMESVLTTAVMNENELCSDYGKSILSHYGYNTDMELRSKYKSAMAAYWLIVILLLVVTSGCGYSAFIYAAVKRRKQEEHVLSALDNMLSEDYSFIEDEQLLHQLDNSLFADLLSKLAENMMLKTEYLNKEQDNTKALVTDISHQLKTPISALKVCFSMYLEADNEKEKAEFRARIRNQIDKLEALAAALINISRLESNMITLVPENTSLDEILIGAMNTVYHKALKQNIDIVTSEFENMTLRLDKKWTSEAIANVLDNAIKYSPTGSKIQIRVKKMYSFIRIEIEDNGIGIPEEEQNKIFRRFYRSGNEFVRSQEGSGVGLYLARKILEDQYGTVSVRSASDKGSIFIIQLPL